jgi:hypothetical protein
MYNNDIYSLNGTQSVNTFTVGFGLGIGADEQQLLNDTAVRERTSLFCQ